MFSSNSFSTSAFSTNAFSFFTAPVVAGMKKVYWFFRRRRLK